MTARLRRVALLGHSGRPAVRRAATRLATRLRRRGLEVRMDDHLGAHSREPGYPIATLGRWCQLMVSLGGDGTALRAARSLAGSRATLLPVNMGGLGFLTAVEESGLDAAADAVVAGDWPVTRRRFVEAARHRAREKPWRGHALNDAVIKTSGGYAALHVTLEALGGDLGHLVADGLIAATPDGSTAYSLSAGGPVMAPGVEAMVVTPVCPHTLASRSLVLPAGEALTVRVLGSFDPILLLLDGQEDTELKPGDSVELRLGRAAVHVVVNPARPFGATLLGKLGWQGSPQRSMR
ncbi:MAG: NAD(+)/NADH kinase [Candidatus Eisenbacteria bacterium]